MEILQTYDFKRPSSSQYNDVAKALVADGATAVRLERGRDFPADVKMTSVQQGVRDVVKKHGKRARTRIEDDDNLVVALWPEGEGPRALRRRRAVAA